MTTTQYPERITHGTHAATGIASTTTHIGRFFGNLNGRTNGPNGNRGIGPCIIDVYRVDFASRFGSSVYVHIDGSHQCGSPEWNDRTPASYAAMWHPVAADDRAVTIVGYDGRSRPMYRYAADMHLPDHARRIVDRADIPVRTSPVFPNGRPVGATFAEGRWDR